MRLRNAWRASPSLCWDICAPRAFLAFGKGNGRRPAAGRVDAEEGRYEKSIEKAARLPYCGAQG